MEIDYNRGNLSLDERNHLNEIKDAILTHFQQFKKRIESETSNEIDIAIPPHMLVETLIDYGFRIKTASWHPLNGGPNNSRKATYLAHSISQQKPIRIKWLSKKKGLSSYTNINAEFAFTMFLVLLHIDIEVLDKSKIGLIIKNGLLGRFTNHDVSDDHVEIIAEIVRKLFDDQIENYSLFR